MQKKDYEAIAEIIKEVEISLNQNRFLLFGIGMVISWLIYFGLS